MEITFNLSDIKRHTGGNDVTRTSARVLSFRGTSPLKQISHNVVPKLHLSAATLNTWESSTHSGAIHGILSTRSGEKIKKKVCTKWPIYNQDGGSPTTARLFHAVACILQLIPKTQTTLRSCIVFIRFLVQKCGKVISKWRKRY